PVEGGGRHRNEQHDDRNDEQTKSSSQRAVVCLPKPHEPEEREGGGDRRVPIPFRSPEDITGEGRHAPSRHNVGSATSSRKTLLLAHQAKTSCWPGLGGGAGSACERQPARSRPPPRYRPCRLATWLFRSGSSGGS